jgi:sulfur-oxidizing protein SoxY
MKTRRARALSPLRRRVVLGFAAATVVRALPVRAEDGALPQIGELDAWLAGRKPAFGRVVLDVPRLADNGNAVPLHMTMRGEFPAGAELKSIRLYSERNPVPLMARFEFPAPPAKVEIDSRIRLAGTQRIAGVAELANGELHAAVAEISVTISACLDGS